MPLIQMLTRELWRNWDGGITQNTPKPKTYKPYLKDIHAIYLAGTTGTAIELELAVLTKNKQRYPDEDKRKDIFIVLFLCRVLCFQPLHLMKSCRRVLLADYQRGQDLPNLLRWYGESIDRIKKDVTGKGWLEKITPVWFGEKICFYNQEYDRAHSSMVKGGWCLGMSIIWLLCKRDNTKFWAGDGQIWGQRTFKIKDIMNKQTQALSGIASVNDLGRIITATEGIYANDIKGKLQRATNSHYRANSTKIIDELTTSIMSNATAGFLLINVSFGSGSGHAMALHRYNGGRSVSFMDPNIGEVRFTSSAKFKEWFPDFMRYMRYKIKSYNVKYFASV